MGLGNKALRHSVRQVRRNLGKESESIGARDAAGGEGLGSLTYFHRALAPWREAIRLSNRVSGSRRDASGKTSLGSTQNCRK
jgi:hypothetical protein